MKRTILPVLIFCVILALAACGAQKAYPTAIGDFETDQETMLTMEDDHGNALAASPGKILLVIYLTPAEGNEVNEDQACAFFYSGSKVAVGGQIYDMKCISLEKVGAKVRYGLVFDIANNGYTEQNKPEPVLQLPQSVPQITPEPTATPIPTPVTVVPTTTPAESSEASPAAS